MSARFRTSFAALLAASLFLAAGDAEERAAKGPRATSQAGSQEFLARHCLDCHSGDEPAGDLDLTSADLSGDRLLGERVFRQLTDRRMPPPDAPRPDESEYDAVVNSLGASLDAAADAHPDPGRTATFRRLTRVEYQNAIRDLLALEIDAEALLPPDESSQGFDNITVGDLSPTLLDRYIRAAETISRLAVGTTADQPTGETYRIPADVTQEEQVEGLPLGTRGGGVFRHHFPQEGEYEIQVRLARDRNEEVEGLDERHEMEVLLDLEPVASFTIDPPKQATDHQTADVHLKARIAVTAGPHDLGVTFLKLPTSLLETKRQPWQAHFNTHRHPRLSPAVYQVSVLGPFDPQGPGDAPSRRRLFTCRSASLDDEERCAKQILSTVARRAYRRPVTEEDLVAPLQLYRDARGAGGSFDAGIEAALSAILVSPHFLFRIELDPPGLGPGSVYLVSDLELASRLSFFLWSSVPDDALLDDAIRGALRDPGVLESHVRRMLADPRAASLVTNFASQWLHLRNLEAITPDLRLFPDFDDNLRQSFRRETELLVESIVREDRSVLDLLRPDHTWLNERLAKHYGIPHVYGSRFRRLPLDADEQRGGLLRQGSVLTVTSYATRTSPVIRGKWILENLLGSPPPPPPAEVPALEESVVGANLPIRERLAAHSTDPACASCHILMDPPGFALENFDAVGRWRDFEGGLPVDASGGLADGREFDGVAGLEQALLDRPTPFVRTLTEKLLTFALGRGVEPADAPAVRRIVREATENDYRLSSIITGIAQSTPFQMRRSE